MGLIDESTFEGCRSLSIVDMPVKLTRIGRRAFKGCTSLKSLILPHGVKEIGLDAFAECSSLARIAIPKGVRELEDEDVFASCDSLTDISFGGSKEAWELMSHGKTVTVLRSDMTVFTPKITFLDLKDEKI
jgi:hypothetical protein